MGDKCKLIQNVELKTSVYFNESENDYFPLIYFPKLPAISINLMKKTTTLYHWARRNVEAEGKWINVTLCVLKLHLFYFFQNESKFKNLYYPKSQELGFLCQYT